jgi:hypothetical protein
LVNPASHLWREFKEPNTALTRARCPQNLALSFHSEPRLAQFKAHPHLLLRTNRCHHLQPNPVVIDIANNAAVRHLNTGVGQRTKFMPVLSPRLSRWCLSCIHTCTRQIAGQNPYTSNFIAGGNYPFSNHAGSEKDRFDVASHVAACSVSTDDKKNVARDVSAIESLRGKHRLPKYMPKRA